jgi:hypothetical protein
VRSHRPSPANLNNHSLTSEVAFLRHALGIDDGNLFGPRNPDAAYRASGADRAVHEQGDSMIFDSWNDRLRVALVGSLSYVGKRTLSTWNACHFLVTSLAVRSSRFRGFIKAEPTLLFGLAG